MQIAFQGEYYFGKNSEFQTDWELISRKNQGEKTSENLPTKTLCLNYSQKIDSKINSCAIKDN